MSASRSKLSDKPSFSTSPSACWSRSVVGSSRSQLINAPSPPRGSGFVNLALKRSGYIFCIRVGLCLNGSGKKGDGSPKSRACLEPRCDICRRDPHFRFVPVDDDWRPLPDPNGEPIVEAETLQALIAADPLRENTERELSPAAYDGAFDAWDLARRHVWRQWMRLTDPVNLQPDVPKAFRDASELLHRHGAQVLGTEDLDRLIACFNTVPSARVQREARALLNRDDASETKVVRLRDLARNLGLRPPEPIDPLPPVEEREVHLVAWMAVRA